MKRPEDYTPQAATYGRGPTRYDGEVVFNHVHYVVALSCKSREEAKKKAIIASTKLCKDIKKLAGRFLAQYPRAQVK